MIKLTKEQIEKAKESISGVYLASWDIILRTASEHLQLPWEFPDDKEMIPVLAAFHDHKKTTGNENRAVQSAVFKFVHERNVTLFPPPVDSRRDIVSKIIQKFEYQTNIYELTDKILAALDESR